jgi:hypothetical protein
MHAYGLSNQRVYMVPSNSVDVPLAVSRQVSPCHVYKCPSPMQSYVCVSKDIAAFGLKAVKTSAT